MIPNEYKEDIISRLLTTKNRSNILELRLYMQGKTEEADTVSKKTKNLSKQIDKLLGQLIDDWNGSTDQVIKSIRNNNASLQKSMNQIQEKIEVADNIVKAIGYIDTALKIAKSF